MGKSKYLSKNSRKSKKNKFGGLKNHPFVIPVITFLLLFFVSITGLILLGGSTLNPSDTHVVSLNIDGEERTVPTRANTVKDLLQRLDIEIGPDDLVEPGLDTKILEDISIKFNTAKPVTVVDGNRSVSILSAYEDPKLAVEKAGFKIFEEDGVKIEAPKQEIGSVIIGQQYVIDRAKEISINLYGNIFNIRTRSNTVDEVLKEKDIKEIDGDTVQPTKETNITNNMVVYVFRLGKKIETTEEIIPAPEEIIDDPTLAVGSLVVRDPGRDGKKIVTYEIETRNGQESSRTVLQEVIATTPLKRIKAKGTKVVLSGGKEQWLIEAGVAPEDYAAADYIISRESGWCPTKWQGEYGACPPYHGTPTSSSIGYGLCQATPGFKMATAGADWGVNPVTQLKWCTNYAKRYGGWQGAYRFWIVNHWW